MIWVSHRSLRLNLHHRCYNTPLHPTRPILNSDFLVAAALIAWPDMNPLEIAGDDVEDDNNEEAGSEVTHLVVDGEFDNFESSCPLELLTRPLSLLHTIQLNAVELRSIGNLKYNLDDLK